LDKLDHSFHSRAVEEVLLGIIVGGNSHDDKVSVFVGRSAICGGSKMKGACSFLCLCQVFFNVVVLDGADIDTLKYFESSLV